MYVYFLVLKCLSNCLIYKFCLLMFEHTLYWEIKNDMFCSKHTVTQSETLQSLYKVKYRNVHEQMFMYKNIKYLWNTFVKTTPQAWGRILVKFTWSTILLPTDTACKKEHQIWNELVASQCLKPRTTLTGKPKNRLKTYVPQIIDRLVWKV